MRMCAVCVLLVVATAFGLTSYATAGYVEYNGAVQSLNPVAYYHLSEAEAGIPPTISPDVASSGGVSDNATYNNFTTSDYQANNIWSILGVPDGGDRAPKFSGGSGTNTTGTYLSVDYSSDIQPKVINATPETVLGDMSLSFFIRKDNAANIRGMIGGWRNLADSNNFLLVDWPSTGILTVTARSNGAPTEFALPGSTALSAGTLYHVVVSLDFNPDDNTLSNGAIYINGINDTGTVSAIDNGSPGISENLNGLSIGRFGSPGATGTNQGIYWNGLIDEFAIFDTALSAGDAASLYSAATAIPEPASIIMVIAGAIAMSWMTRHSRTSK